MVFCLYEGQGEWFDLSKKPIERFSFSFGGGHTEIDGYFITDDCIGCGKCLSVCPQSCIVLNGQKASIKQENCLHCGNCINICPMKAVVLELCKSTPRAQKTAKQLQRNLKKKRTLTPSFRKKTKRGGAYHKQNFTNIVYNFLQEEKKILQKNNAVYFLLYVVY